MPRCACDPRTWGVAVVVLSMALAPLVFAASASAQIIAVPSAVPTTPGGGHVPSQLYFRTLPLYYDGNYRDALVSFRNQNTNGIKTVNSQWIDAIGYFTMSGECYYQMGQLQAALEQYDAALKLFVAYSDWMMRVQFPPAIVPAANPVRATPWGQSKRGAAVGVFADTYVMGLGQIDQTQVVRGGGTIQAPIMFPVHVAEVVRATSLAIRRRRDLMGPVCQHDPLTKNVLDVLLRRPGPPNHWSEAWVSVQLGCAYAAAGSLPQAKTALERAVLVAGQFDHPLTSTALVELARLALEGGDSPAAARYAEEATYACANFPDSNNMEEAFRLGLTAHLLLNQKGPYPPLGPAINWSKVQGPRQLYASLLLLAAENMATLGDTAQASNYLTGARLAMGRSDLASSQLGARLNYLTALAAFQGAGLEAGDRALAAALAFQRTGSLWAFQIELADSRYLAGNGVSDRVAMLLYDAVLREPTPADWTSNPLECLSVLSTPHGPALEHWFELALKNTNGQELALEIADRARRHRFFSTLPMGGRLMALRWILEGPVSMLGERGLLERQDLLARFPKYGQLAQQSAQIRAKLAAGPLVDDAAEARREQADLLAALAKVSQAQEVILREIAVRREPAEMIFPPLRKSHDVQQSLPDGQVLLAFFATRENLYAFLFSRDRYAAWNVQKPAQLQKQIGVLLREMGNYDANREVTPAELAKDSWRTAAASVTKMLLARSNVDLAGNFDEIVVVPDGFLWYLPFEVLSVGPPGRQKLLMSQARVRYAPTVGLAVPYGRAQKPRPRVGVALGRLHPQDDDSVAAEAFGRIASVVDGAVALPRSLPAPASVYRVLLDGLIVLDDIEPGDGAYEWAPVQFDRQQTTGTLASWFSLPLGGPENVILPGFHTAAEAGIRKGRTTGEEIFLSVCGLMSAGARTILISRWRTGGQTCFELVREFAQELPHATAAEAWQRSVQLASETPLEPDREPRVKAAAPGRTAAKASHPFFWAGYMLVDSGALPPSVDKPLDLPGKVAPARPQPANPPVDRLTPQSIVGDGLDGAPPSKDAAEAKPAARAKSKAGPAKKPLPPSRGAPPDAAGA
ncbi:MAG: CHAT domain-containing protein [Pirellulales bacterium]